MSTFNQWRREILAEWPDAHITYGSNEMGVNWAEAWEEGTKRTLGTWQPAAPSPVIPATPQTDHGGQNG